MPRFEKGNPPGPGRPPGCRNKATVWLDELAREDTEQLVRNVTEQANAGNMRAAGIVLARTWPRRRGARIKVELPAADSAGGVVQAQAALIAAVAEGQLSAEEAISISTLLENQRRAIETHDLEARIAAFEKGEGAESLDDGKGDLLAAQLAQLPRPTTENPDPGDRAGADRKEESQP